MDDACAFAAVLPGYKPDWMPEYRWAAQAPTLYDDVVLSNPYPDNEINVARVDKLNTVPVNDVPSYNLSDDEHDDVIAAGWFRDVIAEEDCVSAASMAASLR
jgi:hypothetical protein